MGNEQQIKDTGKLVAHFRRSTDIPYCADIADLTGAYCAGVDLLGAERLEKAGWLAPLFEVRYKSVSQQLKRLGHKNILELCVGMSPRSLEFTADPTVTYVDSDQDGVIEQRRALLNTLMHIHHLQRPNIHFEKIDCMKTGDYAAGTRHFNGKPFAMVQEGLWPYCSLERKVHMAACARENMVPGSVWINPDIMMRPQLEASACRDPDRFDLLRAMYGATGEDFIANAFPDAASVDALFHDAGFDIERHPRYDGSYRISSIDRLQLDPERVMPVVQRGEILILRPR